MGNGLSFQNLKDNRDEILKAEIGSLLFNLGKTHAGFSHWKQYFSNARQKFSSYKKYYKEDYFKKELDNIDNKLSDFIFTRKVKLSNNTLLDWKEFFFGDVSNSPFVKKVFFRGCENINSGIDKGSPKENSQLSTLWISNAFGAFKYNPKIEDFDKSREKFLKDFHKFLDGHKYYTDPKWDTIRGFVFENIKPWYSCLLSDSRFPINDVTLWDQAYMTASMFKAVFAQIFLDPSKFEVYQNNPSSIKWSILGIQYDKLSLAEKGLKPGSIKWYRDKCEEVDNRIKELIEINYAIGNEVYRDETGIYFIVGEDLIGEKDVKFYKLHDNLDGIKKEIQEIFSNTFKGETYPAIFLTEPSRGLMNLGYLIENAKENFLKVEIPENFNTYIKHDSNPDGICQICGIRMAHKGNKENLICDVCQNRLKGRLNKWVSNSSGETIWTSELQDKSGRIALITLKFELNEWINGNMVNSLIVQNFDLNTKKYIDYLNSVIDGLLNNKKLKKTLLKDYSVNIPNIDMRDLVEKWFLERSIGTRWEKFICSRLEDELKKGKIDFKNRKILWQNLTDSDIEFLAELILQFLLRKNPSPARLRRVWETTREFFVELEDKINSLIGIEERMYERFVWDKNELNGEYEDGDILFWAYDGKVYLISSMNKVGNKKEFKLKKYREGENDTLILKKEEAQKQTYKPYFTILPPTPISWQFIIPAENVPKLIGDIQKKYYEDFKWVYGKLPLHIGVVVQDYKKPLYIGVKALRRIRRDSQEWENLRIKIDKKDFKVRQDKAIGAKTQVEKDDDPEVFYSLFEKLSGKGKYEFYLYPKKRQKQWIDTVKDSADDDKFYFYSNTFDFEFLDVNTRRNDIYYEQGKRVKGSKRRRPYDIEKWEYFRRFKEYFGNRGTTSNLQNLVYLIYSKLEDWKEDLESLKKFMISSFINILNLNTEEKRDEFCKILGLENFEEFKKLSEKEFEEVLIFFLDMFEFWHKCLKEV